MIDASAEGERWRGAAWMVGNKNNLGVLFAVSCFCVRAALAQGRPVAPEVVSLTVPAGVPVDVVLEKSLPIKTAGVPVQARVVDPIFVFDHMVIPAGSQVLGRVTQVESAPRKQRGLAIANGNFSPLRKAHVDFDTLILKDGTRLHLQTTVTQGALRMVHLIAGEQGKKKGRVSRAVEQARQEAKAREQETVKELAAPGKIQRVKARLWAEFPYHQPALAAGTHFTAELKTPLEFGKEDCSPKQLENLGSGIPQGSDVEIRLLTPLSSAADHLGSPVKARGVQTRVFAQPPVNSPRGGATGRRRDPGSAGAPLGQEWATPLHVPAN